MTERDNPDSYITRKEFFTNFRLIRNEMKEVKGGVKEIKVALIGKGLEGDFGLVGKVARIEEKLKNRWTKKEVAAIAVAVITTFGTILVACLK